VVKQYNVKYHWNLALDNLPGPFYKLQLQVVFGWLSDDTGLDGGAAFHGTAARWRFTSNTTAP